MIPRTSFGSVSRLAQNDVTKGFIHRQYLVLAVKFEIFVILKIQGTSAVGIMQRDFLFWQEYGWWIAGLR